MSEARAAGQHRRANSGPAGLDSSGETAAARVLSPRAERHPPAPQTHRRVLTPKAHSFLRHLALRDTAHLTSAKAKGLLAEKCRQTAVVPLQPLRQTPTKWRPRRHPTTSSGGSSATYAELARMRHGASCPPTDPARGRGVCDVSDGGARSSILRLRSAGAARRWRFCRPVRLRFFLFLGEPGRPPEVYGACRALGEELCWAWPRWVGPTSDLFPIILKWDLHRTRPASRPSTFLAPQLQVEPPERRVPECSLLGQLSDQDMSVTWRFRSKLDLEKFT